MKAERYIFGFVRVLEKGKQKTVRVWVIDARPLTFAVVLCRIILGIYAWGKYALLTQIPLF